MEQIKKKLLLKRCIKFSIFLLLILLLRSTGITNFFTFEKFKAYNMHLKEMVEADYLKSVALYMAAFFGVVLLMIPAVPFLAAVGGFLFDVIPGALYGLTSASIAALLTFLIARYAFGDFLQKKYGAKLAAFNDHVKEEGARYLLAVHFMLVLPFVFINTIAALTPITTWTFFWTTVVGSAPLFFLASFAGEQLSEMEKLSDMFSWEIILVFAILIMVLLSPTLIKWIKRLRK